MREDEKRWGENREKSEGEEGNKEEMSRRSVVV